VRSCHSGTANRAHRAALPSPDGTADPLLPPVVARAGCALSCVLPWLTWSFHGLLSVCVRATSPVLRAAPILFPSPLPPASTSEPTCTETSPPGHVPKLMTFDSLLLGMPWSGGMVADGPMGLPRVPSPCGNGGGRRGCSLTSNTYSVLRGRWGVPVLQTHTRSCAAQRPPTARPLIRARQNCHDRQW
jgi:hypothetical protein